MKPIERIKAEIVKFESVTWSSCGYPIGSAENGDFYDVGWVKFRLDKSELAWRTLEFMSWLVDDMAKAGENIQLIPTSSPPYLNTPGECLSFVLECYPKNGDSEQRFAQVANFINECRKEYWEECKVN